MRFMVSIAYITLETENPTAATNFYSDALNLGDRVRLKPSEAPTAGFPGFVLGLVVAQPAIVNTLMDNAAQAGGTVLKPAAKSLWGYGGALQAPNGTVVTLASSTKKDTGPAGTDIDNIVLQLGVADVAASKNFYLDQGFTVAKSYGRKYVEFDSGPITLTLNTRKGLAKTAGVSDDGSGSHRLMINGPSEAFTDLDGFEWAPA